jgi:regulatory protein
MASRRPARSKSADADRASDPEAIRAAAIALLARRDFASGELRDKLSSQGYDHTLVAETVAELVAERLLDDARYGENYVAYHADRGQGPVRIGADLKALGLPAEAIEAAIASGPDWRALAREVRVRKFGQAPPGDWAEKGRQARFLQYRGFSSDHIRSAIGPDFDPDEPS